MRFDYWLIAQAVPVAGDPFTSWLSDPSKVGATAIMIAIIVAFYRGYVVTGAAHTRQETSYEKRLADLAAQYDSRLKACVEEKDEYKRMVLSMIDLTDRTLAAKGAPHVERTGTGK